MKGGAGEQGRCESIFLLAHHTQSAHLTPPEARQFTLTSRLPAAHNQQHNVWQTAQAQRSPIACQNMPPTPTRDGAHDDRRVLDRDEGTKEESEEVTAAVPCCRDPRSLATLARRRSRPPLLPPSPATPPPTSGLAGTSQQQFMRVHIQQRGGERGAGGAGRWAARARAMMQLDFDGDLLEQVKKLRQNPHYNKTPGVSPEVGMGAASRGATGVVHPRMHGTMHACSPTLAHPC